MEYVRSMLPVTQELFGVAGMCDAVGRTARLMGMQLYDETAAALGIRETNATSFATYLAAMQSAQGEEVIKDGSTVNQSGWRLMAGLARPGDAMFHAWNTLWQGALAVHDRDLKLVTVVEGPNISWRIE